MKILEFNNEELAQYDGKNGSCAYIAYNGLVYDVSQSFLWQDGRHQALHGAGTDLTAALGQAPHDDDLLRIFPVAGVLRED